MNTLISSQSARHRPRRSSDNRLGPVVALSAAAAEICDVNMLASVFQLGCLQKRDSTDNSAIIFVWKFKIFDNMWLRLRKQNATFNIKQLLQFISVVCHNAECLPFCEQGTHLPFGDLSVSAWVTEWSQQSVDDTVTWPSGQVIGILSCDWCCLLCCR